MLSNLMRTHFLFHRNTLEAHNIPYNIVAFSFFRYINWNEKSLKHYILMRYSLVHFQSTLEFLVPKESTLLLSKIVSCNKNIAYKNHYRQLQKVQETEPELSTYSLPFFHTDSLTIRATSCSKGMPFVYLVEQFLCAMTQLTESIRYPCSFPMNQPLQRPYSFHRYIFCRLQFNAGRNNFSFLSYFSFCSLWICVWMFHYGIPIDGITHKHINKCIDTNPNLHL